MMMMDLLMWQLASFAVGSAFTAGSLLFLNCSSEINPSTLTTKSHTHHITITYPYETEQIINGDNIVLNTSQETK